MTEATMPEAQAPVAASEATTVEAILNTATAETPKPETDPAEQDAGKVEEDNTPFPKKAINALSRRDKQIGKLRAHNEHITAELNKLREEGAARQQKPNSAPSEKDFTNYADFLEAKNNYAIEQKFAEHARKTETTQQQTAQTQQAAQYNQWVSERTASLDKQSEDFAKEHPDFTAVLNQNAELVASFSPHLKHALLQADNAPLAILNLAREGKLYDLPDMSLEDARVEIRLAQRTAVAKPQSKAPAPLPASRGSVPASKPLDKLDPREAWKLLQPKD